MRNTCTNLNLFNGGWSSRAELKDACCSLVNKILLCPPFHEFLASRKSCIENTGWKLRNNARNAVSRRRKSEGKREREKKGEKKKVCGTKEKARSHRVGRLWKMRCQEYTVESPGIYRYSVEFLWTNEAVIERLQNRPTTCSLPV